MSARRARRTGLRTYLSISIQPSADAGNTRPWVGARAQCTVHKGLDGSSDSGVWRAPGRAVTRRQDVYRGVYEGGDEERRA